VQQKNAINRLIGELSRLPGIGRKTAERLAYFIVKENGSFADELARAIREVKERVAFCSVCGNLTEEDPCAICSNPGRNGKTICVVEEPKDVWAIEKTGTYSGLYHVLMGSLSPLDGIGPDKLRIRELLSRVTDEVEEIIIAACPLVKALRCNDQSSVMRRNKILSFSRPVHHSMIFLLGSPVIKTSVAGASRPLPLFTRSAPCTQCHSSKYQECRFQEIPYSATPASMIF